MEQSILEFIVKIAAYGGGAAVIAYWVFTFLGKKWIEAKFADSLERSRHEHAKEIEHLRFEINSLLNRVTKLHQKEFEVVPEAWSKLNDALFRLRGFVSFFKQFPDLNQMTPEQLSDFLQKSPFSTWECEDLKNSGDLNKRYQQLIFWHELADVRKLYGEYHEYIQKNRIFMSIDLCEPFTKIDSIMWDTLVTRWTRQEIEDPKLWVEASRKMRGEVEPLLHEIERLVQQRLQSREIV
jgi:hypothetical protein